MAKSSKKTAAVAKKSGLTRQGVHYKRKRGETDEEIISGQGKSDPYGETLAAAQLRKEKALADLRELEYRQKSGELIPVIEMQNAWSVLVRVTRNNLTAMPASVADQLAAITDPVEVRQFLTVELDRRLGELADEFQHTAIRALDDGDPGDPAAGTADGDGMGGEVPEA